MYRTDRGSRCTDEVELLGLTEQLVEDVSDNGRRQQSRQANSSEPGPVDSPDATPSPEQTHDDKVESRAGSEEEEVISVSPALITFYRKDLASKLNDLFDNGVHELAVDQLKELVDRFRKLWLCKAPYFESLFGGSFNDKHGILENWLQSIDAFADLRSMADFDARTTTRAEFVRTLSASTLKRARPVVLRMRAKISRWRRNENFSKKRFARDVADVLIVMADWAGMMGRDGRQELLTEVNQFLFAWFE
ncbi:hypothetical protein CC86DRAFT_169007 [Ophiobolus disseminans]|uniref:Uncharacterized protein n=1 Tax=Ophiobolus disseminans TaxID=1469910 RepID=A0A6A7ACD4_9PLEO|nr:hypothetical protein CC86DRAFT_169007 [Ophiobolus disseminans]